MKIKDSKTISVSEAKYIIDSKNSSIIYDNTKIQSTYNIPERFFHAVEENNILVENSNFEYSRKSTDGNAYVLADNYRLKLGLGIIWLIGDEYKTKENKFIVSVANKEVSKKDKTKKIGKPQLFRKIYNELQKQDEGYSWFVKLFDKNLAGNEFVLEIDEQNKFLIVDVNFTGIQKSIDITEIQVSDEESDYDATSFDYTSINLPHNRIVFGAPGTGKSYKLNEDKQLFNNNFERVTFHPNYSYAQFVGTYKPVPQDGGITYKYVPGPFIRTYVKAIKSINNGNPKPYLLLIEEINRANVASVFGDIFQLLDRKDGQSEYEIETSEDMRTYLLSELGGNKSEYTRIRIPQNMYIWATMNSADQGVFPMDTAFKRRWNFEYIGINENSEGIKDIIVKLGEDEHDVKWNDLRIAINNKLSKVCKVNEDKLLGPYFLSKDVINTLEGSNYVEDNKKFIEAFKNKVLMYLYEDAAKQYKHKLFEGCKDHSKYSSVCESFEKVGEAIFGEGILSYIVDGE